MKIACICTHDLSYLSAAEHAQLNGSVVEIKKMLAAFIAKRRAEG